MCITITVGVNARNSWKQYNSGLYDKTQQQSLTVLLFKHDPGCPSSCPNLRAI